MARTEIQIRYTMPPEQVNNLISTILTRSGYSYINENGESVWKRGTGFLEAMQYIKIEFISAGDIKISGWIRMTGGGEKDLNGFVAAIPKKKVMKVIQEIQMSVR